MKKCRWSNGFSACKIQKMVKCFWGNFRWDRWNIFLFSSLIEVHFCSFFRENALLFTTLFGFDSRIIVLKMSTEILFHRNIVLDVEFFVFQTCYAGVDHTAEYGPGRTGQIFVYFAKKFVTSCLRQVRPVNFKSTKFCQSLPNFKDAVVLPRSRTNFCQAWNLTDLLIYTPWFEGKCQSRKFDLYFQSEYWSPKLAKIISRTRTLQSNKEKPPLA